MADDTDAELRRELARILAAMLVKDYRETGPQPADQPLGEPAKTVDPPGRWGDVDAARAYLAGMKGGRMPSRKQVYDMVQAGLKVARLGESGRRMLFCREWIEEFLERQAGQGGAR